MAKFILKDQRGNEQEFDHDKIFVMGTDGELVQFTQGEGDTPAVVQPLEVTENGTYTAPDGVDGFNEVTVNVDPTWKNILVKDEIGGFAFDSTFGAFSPGYVYPAAFALEAGKTYKVSWDGEIFDDRVAFAIPIDPNQQIIAIGNASSLGLQGNNEPFLILHNQTYNNTQLFSTDTDESHSVGIWEKVAATSNDVRYVTFKNHDGTVEYGKKAVAVGDDCADPIARGIFTTPTRESDAQYNYTFYGWATTPNGAADSSWNKTITEDKTVYANFSKTLRTYTITFYDADGSTVLTTKTVAYGSVPSYTPTKNGYDFSGWNPTPVAVTGNASYTATWTEEVNFATASWARITEIAKNGEAQKYFSVGETKSVALTSFGTITIAIAGFNQDDLADGTGKAPISFVFTIAPTKKHEWSSSSDYYANSRLHKYLNTDSSNLLAYFPSDLRSVIKSVNKKYCNNNNNTSTNVVSAKLWALSLSEMGDTGISYTLGDRYPLFTAQKIKGVDGVKLPISAKDASGATITGFWLRDLSGYGTIQPCYCKVSTASTNTYYVTWTSSYTETYHLVCGFCIG